MKIESSSCSSSVIPIIRLPRDNDDDHTAKEVVVAQVREACKDVGFFYLQGHGIESEFLQAVLHQSKLFFDLDTESKKRLSDPVMSRGYTAFEEETLDPVNQPARGDTKEGFYIGTDISPSHPRYNPAKFRGPNQWPTPETTPDMAHFDTFRFRSVMEEYFVKMSALGFRVVRLLALALELPESFFDEAFAEPMALIRLLHYAPVESKPEEGVYACGAHSDYGMITLLLTDANPGLQILNKENNEWHDAQPIPDTFVVNLGDMLERWSNGLFRSTVHRVLTAGDAHRYSIPFFYDPTFDTVVKCLDVCGDTAKYPQTTSGEHLISKYKQTHADFQPA